MEILTLQVPDKEKALLLEVLKKFNVKIIETSADLSSEEAVARINKAIKPGKKPSLDEIVKLSRPGRQT